MLGAAILLAGITTQKMESLAIPLSLMIAISIGGSRSGAHYNPAVTLSVIVGGKYYKKSFMAILYMAS